MKWAKYFIFAMLGMIVFIPAEGKLSAPFLHKTSGDEEIRPTLRFYQGI